MVWHIYRAGGGSGSFRTCQYFYQLQFRIPDCAPCKGGMSLVNLTGHLARNAPSTGTVRLVATSATITTSVATPVGTATTTSIKPWDVCSFCCDLKERGSRYAVRLDRQKHTFISRPRNNELSKANAASTNSGSANSTYANLEKAIRETQLGEWRGF